MSHDQSIAAGYERTGDDWVKNPAMAVLEVLCRISAKHSKLYSFPSHQTIIELMLRWTGRVMSTRSLSRHLGALERDKWILRQRRHERGHLGDIAFHSTLYILCRRTVKSCRALGTSLWIHSTRWANSLFDIAGPILAESLTREHQLTTTRPAKWPPKT